jgi:hypothetical protein
MKRWQLSADADATVVDLTTNERSDTTHLAMELTFDALTPAIGTDGQGRTQGGASASTATTVGKGHLEQAGRWSGWLSAGDDRWEWGGEARGNRDKSWGPRRWGGPQMWRWFSINLGDDVHFGGIRIGTPAGDLHRGWVWRDDEATSIDEWKVRTELADDGVTHAVSHVTAVDRLGRAHELRADVLRVYGAPRRTGERATVVLEGLARWSYEGRSGYGISEYLHQLDEHGKPLVPIE